MNITLNGKACDTKAGNIMSLLEEKNYRPELVAVEVNEDIISKEKYAAYPLKEGDLVEIVTFMGGGEEKDVWFLGKHEFSSRFILGSGKYSLELISAAVEQAGAQIVTLALRRANQGGWQILWIISLKALRFCLIPPGQGMPGRQCALQGFQKR